MRTRSQNPFTTITTSGLLLPVDLLSRIVDGDPDLPGLDPKTYHLRSGERLNEAASRAWNECLTAWKMFRKRFDALPASDAGTTLTRDEWLLPLFQQLGYGRLQTKKAIEIDGQEYPVSHGWENHVPIHLLSARLKLDRRTPGVPGAATRAPYSLLQELLNRSAQHRWGFVSNGLKLYLLRDNAALARAANVEFDLEAMMDGEVSSDFMLLFLLCHQSRVEVRGSARGDQGSEEENPEDCWLEQWAEQADQQGTRAREKLRDGVEAAISSLGAGFLTTRGNDNLRARLRSGELSTQDYYRQLLRVVYRVLMLLVAEEKKTETGENLLHPLGTPPEVRQRYARFYSVSRVRSLAYERRGTGHVDVYESLKVLFSKLRRGYEPLGIPGMGSFLFSEDATSDLDAAALANQDLLQAFRHLCYTEDTSGRGGGVRRPVDFGNLGSEELGSVYESLLELHPRIDTDEGPFKLTTAAGHERKTTGSYYTPTSLINCLLDSALDPVVHEAIDVADPAEAEKNLLALKVCDPACGSGHFLIAAAERMAMHLARIRTSDDQPGTLDVQHAKRDVLSRCIYGVDVNPMAVELCKVSLWMEALEPGKPLSFLDHHIQCGNSLLGTTPRLLANGVPPDAFKPIEGDDKEVCKELKARNKNERSGARQGTLQGELWDREGIPTLGNMPAVFASLSTGEESTIDAVREKEIAYATAIRGDKYRYACLLADLWCAAFVWKKIDTDIGRLCPTQYYLKTVEQNPHSIPRQMETEVKRLTERYQFFHWHLAFPDVFRLPTAGEAADNEQTGWNGGFDIVLGNPPWDMQEVKDNEFFSVHHPEVLGVKSAKDKAAVLESIKGSDPDLWASYRAYVRLTYSTKHFLLNSGRYPLSAVGRLNLYRAFLETDYTILNLTGAVGTVVPSGFASDSFSQPHFTALHQSQKIASLYDFENKAGLFPGVHKSFKFCLLTLVGSLSKVDFTDFVFFAHTPRQLNESDRHVPLSPQDLRQLNPFTSTAPLFRREHDRALTIKLHADNPVVGDQSETGWNIRPTLMFMPNASMKHHRAGDELEEKGMSLIGNRYVSKEETWFPLIEGKMVGAFDHRASSIRFDPANRVRRNQAVALSTQDHQNPDAVAQPVFWVSDSELRNRCGELPRWCPVIKDVTSATNERTCIAAILPTSALTDSVPWLKNQSSGRLNAALIANLNSFALDFAARQKVAGLHLRGHYLAQLPILHKKLYASPAKWSFEPLGAFIGSRSLELIFTSWDLKLFAADSGYHGPPFHWDDKRRFFIRCELDAAYFNLYLGNADKWRDVVPGELAAAFATARDAIGYVMDTFPIVRRRDEKTHGEYRTKRVILEIYDEMAEAVRTGRPYQTRLDPPPGPPTDANGNFIPFDRWTADLDTSHIHPPHETARSASAKPTRTTTPTPTPRVPAVAASAGGPFPATAPQKLLVGLTADLVIRFPGSLATVCRQMQGLALKPPLVAKLILSEDKQGELNAAVAQLPPAFTQISSADAPWSKVLQTLLSADAIDASGDDDSAILSPGKNCDEVIAHFGTLPEPYMQLVGLAITAYQSSATEELDRGTSEAVQQAQQNWLAETEE